MQTERTLDTITDFRVDIVLLEPEIPQNTGNIVRTSAAVGSTLHLIEPLGFSLEDKYLKRAGLDYWSLMNIEIHKNFDDFLQTIPRPNLFLFSKKAGKSYHEAQFTGHCLLIFGKETWGLPDHILDRFPDNCYRIPMRSEARSLNLSNSVAITVYEALRQNNFPGLLQQNSG